MISTVNQSKKGTGKRRSDAARNSRTYMFAFRTALDWMAIAWRDEMLCGAVFGYSSERQAGLALARVVKLPDQICRSHGDGQADEFPAWVDELRDDLCRFSGGEPVDFSHVPLNLEHLTAFGRGVVAECRRIRSGQVSTYGELADKCGKPGAARAVGSVMAKNRFPLVVPCHRVLGAGGSLGGYSAPDGLRMKRRLLAMEALQ